MKKIFFILSLSLFSIFTCAVVNAEPISIELPTVVMNVPEKNNSNYYVTLESLESTNPMPTNNQKMTIRITGNNEGKFGAITFTEPGYYHYKVYQSNTNLKKIKYDNKVYEITIQISREEGNVLRATTAMKKSGSNIKSTVISFYNTSKVKKQAINPYTGDKIVKYFVISIVSILLILIIIVYIKHSRSDE